MARVNATAVDISQGQYTYSIPTGATAIQISVYGSSGYDGGSYYAATGGTRGQSKVGAFQFVNNGARTLTINTGLFNPDTSGERGEIGDTIVATTTPFSAFQRYYSSSTGLHFYVNNPDNEFLSSNGYQLENQNYFWINPNNNIPQQVPLYRFLQTNGPGDHLFTTNSNEVSGNGWVYEGVVGYVFTTYVVSTVNDALTSAVYRKFNGVDHLLTVDPYEGNSSGYVNEGIVFYAVVQPYYSNWPIVAGRRGWYGGYGGRALSVVDSQTGNIVIVAGGAGGGGGGSATLPNTPTYLATSAAGGNGADVGSYIVGTPSSLGKGGTGATNLGTGGGGGGGGGNASAVGAGGGGGGGGGAGGSRYRSAEVTFLSEYSITAQVPGAAVTYEEPVAAPGAPTITSFTASPTSIASGGTSTLTWSYTNGTSASINQGVGDVTSLTNKSVNPTTTTTYTLTVTNSVGVSVTAQVTVTVTTPVPGAPTITSFTASPTSIVSGSSSTLTWTSTNGASASINNGVGGVGLNTSTVVYPTTTTTYTLTVTGPGGSVTQPVTVTVTIIIDQQPDSFVIPASEGLTPNQINVVSPSLPDPALTILGINVPVEITANAPIQISINGGNWLDIRQSP